MSYIVKPFESYNQIDQLHAMYPVLIQLERCLPHSHGLRNCVHAAACLHTFNSAGLLISCCARYLCRPVAFQNPRQATQKRAWTFAGKIWELLVESRRCSRHFATNELLKLTLRILTTLLNSMTLLLCLPKLP